jgi:hypothetical protein
LRRLRQTAKIRFGLQVLPKTACLTLLAHFAGNFVLDRPHYVVSETHVDIQDFILSQGQVGRFFPPELFKFCAVVD